MSEKISQIKNNKSYHDLLLGEGKPAKTYEGKNPLWNTVRKIKAKIEIQYGKLEKGDNNLHVIFFFRVLNKELFKKATDKDNEDSFNSLDKKELDEIIGYDFEIICPNDGNRMIDRILRFECQKCGQEKQICTCPYQVKKKNSHECERCNGVIRS